MEIIHMPINELVRYENNPRDNAKAVEYVAQSIKNFGFKVPIIIDRNNVIVAGDTRYQAAQRLGLKELPCVKADDLTDEQVKALRLADNKVAEHSKWDMDKLEAELEELLTMDMTIFGFEDMEKELEEAQAEIKADSDFNYKEQYGVIVMCCDEQEQQVIYERLVEEGYDCKVVAT